MNRRDVLRNGGIALTIAPALGLAGCTGGSEPTETVARTEASTATETNTPTQTPTVTETSAPTEPRTTTECPGAGSPTTATAASDVNGESRSGLTSRIEEQGHYTWFALGEGTWGRQRTPFDIRDSCSRWLAEPTPTGAIRCFVQGIDASPLAAESVGFDLHLGRLGDVEEIRIPHEVIQSGQFNAQLAVALFLDENEDGTFFAWEEIDGGRESWDGFGGDEEAAKTVFAGDPVVINDETQFRLFNRESATASLGQLKNDEIEWLGDASKNKPRESGENRGIDADTEAALYVGLVDNGDGEANEAIVRDVVVE
jgi:hypothetical protein